MAYRSMGYFIPKIKCCEITLKEQMNNVNTNQTKYFVTNLNSHLISQSYNDIKNEKKSMLIINNLPTQIVFEFKKGLYKVTPIMLVTVSSQNPFVPP